MFRLAKCNLHFVFCKLQIWTCFANCKAVWDLHLAVASALPPGLAWSPLASYLLQPQVAHYYAGCPLLRLPGMCVPPAVCDALNNTLSQDVSDLLNRPSKCRHRIRRVEKRLLPIFVRPILHIYPGQTAQRDKKA